MMVYIMSETVSENPDFSGEPSPVDPASVRRKQIAAILALLALPLLLAGVFFTWYQFSRGVLVYAVVQVRLANEEEANPEILRQKRNAQVKSFEVLSHALTEPQVAQLPVVKRQANAMQWLENELKVDIGGSLDSVILSIRGSDASELMVVVDAVAEAFVKSMGIYDPEGLRRKAQEMKEKAKMMEDRMPPQIKEFFKKSLNTKVTEEQTPRARIVQQATVAK